MLAASGGAQQIIQLPAEDSWLEADFKELYRLGSMAGEDWEQFGILTEVAFDGKGNLQSSTDRPNGSMWWAPTAG